MFVACFLDLVEATKLQRGVSVNGGSDVIALLHAAPNLSQLSLTADIRQSALYLCHVGYFEGFAEGEVAVPEHPPARQIVSEVVELVVRLQ